MFPLKISLIESFNFKMFIIVCCVDLSGDPTEIFIILLIVNKIINILNQKKYNKSVINDYNSDII